MLFVRSIPLIFSSSEGCVCVLLFNKTVISLACISGTYELPMDTSSYTFKDFFS